MVAPFGRPTVRELVEAVREHLEATMATMATMATTATTEGSEVDRARFEARIGRNILGMVERELVLGPGLARAHSDRLAALGFAGDERLAMSIRSGAFDHDFLEVGQTLAASTREQLLVANPSYLSDAKA